MVALNHLVEVDFSTGDGQRHTRRLWVPPTFDCIQVASGIIASEAHPFGIVTSTMSGADLSVFAMVRSEIIKHDK